MRALSADNLRLLKEQCFEIKTTSNTISEDTMKIKTRLMGLEREIVKRDRILKALEHVNQYGPGITMDILEKLREERGLASLYKKKAQDLIVQIEDKDKDVRQLKQDRHFTDIVERQVELASWQHEAQRLASLLKEPSPELNDVAKQEIDVLTQYVEKLKSELSNVEEKRDSVETELAEFKGEHATAEGEHQERLADLTKEQDITRSVASSFKEVLQKRKSMEQMEDEIESMRLEMQRMDEEPESRTCAIPKFSTSIALSRWGSGGSHETLSVWWFPPTPPQSSSVFRTADRPDIKKSSLGYNLAKLLYMTCVFLVAFPS